MTIRMTGMYSNMDTDSIISQLMKAQRTKIETIEKKKTKLEWKVDAWSTLNSKIYSLYTGTLNEMRFTDKYNKKSTTISDSTVATITADSSAVDGTQELAVKKLAKPGYLTGSVLSTSDSTTLSSSSTMSQLTGYSATGDTSFQVSVGSGAATSITINSSTTISDVITQLKSAGVNASFDSTNSRIFVSSKSSGAASDFTITASDSDGTNALTALGLNTEIEGGATKIDGQDSEILLNGATFTSTSNAFSINGLNIVAKELTGTSTDSSGNTIYDTVSISTSMDYQGIYDTVKSFLSEYNTLINEMDSLYNADSAKGYDPLTDDEKDAMTDTQIEKWETKIKDALLRRDSTLGSVSNTMKNAMTETYEIDGKTYSLASFGISTGEYFTTEENERSAYHIDGNTDDTTVSTEKDKLMTAIVSDPDTVISFFTSLSKGLYDKIDKNMKSVEGIKSVYHVYEDKTMASQIDDYEDKIDELEDKFTTMENKYYDQFSAMETALAKLQSSSSSLLSMLGS